MDPPLSATAVGIPTTSLLFYPKPVILFIILCFFTSLFLRLLYLKGGTNSRGTSLKAALSHSIWLVSPKIRRISGERNSLRKKNISRYKWAGYPPARFSGHGTLYRAAANCFGPRTASGRRGVEQCDPQPLLWYSIPASCIPHTEGGSEEMLCSPSASGFRSRALQPAVLPPGGVACVSHKTLFPAPQALDSRGVHRGLLVSLASFTPPTATAPCQNDRSCSLRCSLHPADEGPLRCPWVSGRSSPGHRRG